MASGDGSGGGSSGRRSVQEILGMFNKKKDSPVIPRTSADAAAAAAPAAASGPKPGRTKLASAGLVSSGNGSGGSSRQDAASWLPSRSSAGTGSSNAASNTGSRRSATTAAADWLPESPSKGTTGKSTGGGGGTGPGSGPLSSIPSPDSRPIAAGPTAAALGSMSPLRKFGAAAKQEQEQEQQEQERLRKAALAAASAAAKASAGGTKAGPSFFLGRSTARTPPTSAPGTPSRVFAAPAVKPAAATAAAVAPAAAAAVTSAAAVEAEQPRKLGVKKWPPEPDEKEPEDPVKALEKQLEKANVEIAFLKARNAEQAAQLKKLQATAAFNDIAAGAAARRRSRSSFQQQQQQPPLTPQMLPPASESAAATRWRLAREGGLRVSVGGGSAGQSLPSSPRADSTREDKGFESPGSVWSVDEGECRQCGRLRDQLEAVEAERVALEEHRTAREVELISARAQIARLEQTLASTPGHGPRRSLRFPQPSSMDRSSASSSSSSSTFRSRGMHPRPGAGQQDSSRQQEEDGGEEEQHRKPNILEEEEEGEGGAAGPVVVTVRPWTDPQVTELRHALGSAMGAYRSTLESLKKAEAALKGRADAVLEQAASESFRVSLAQRRFTEGVV